MTTTSVSAVPLEEPPLMILCTLLCLVNAAMDAGLKEKIPERERKKAEKEQKEQEDLFDLFRKESMKNDKIQKGKLSIHSDIAFNNEQASIFKMIMVKLLDESIKGYEEADKEKKNLPETQWLQDPVALGWLRKIFVDYMGAKELFHAYNLGVFRHHLHTSVLRKLLCG